MSVIREMDKDFLGYSFNEIILSNKNSKLLMHAAIRMNLEDKIVANQRPDSRVCLP